MKLVIVLTALTIYPGACSNNSEIKKNIHIVQPTSEKIDSGKSVPLVEDMIGKAIKTDSLLNPYLTQKEEEDMKACNQPVDTATLFNCVINQFKTARTPIQLGPVPEPDYTKQKGLYDSLFIVQCLQDTNFLKEAPEDRTYSWYKGKVIDKNKNYTLCLILLGFNVGFEYFLCSFNTKGQLIAKKEVGAQASDWYEIYGFINNNNSFEIYKNEFDSQNEKPVIKSKSHEKYIIDKDGRFVKR